MTALLALAQFLPSLLSLGAAAAPLASQLISHVTGNTTATTEVEKYTATILQVLPAAIGAGIDVLAVVQHERAIINGMLNAGRGPTTAEWDAQAVSIEKLEAAWKAASGTT